MNARDIELAAQAGAHWEHGDWNMASSVHFSEEELKNFADLIRADERDTFIAFIQDYPHWLGDNAKREIISAIRARGNT